MVQDSQPDAGADFLTIAGGTRRTIMGRRN